jgi:hypothetical protein
VACELQVNAPPDVCGPRAGILKCQQKEYYTTRAAHKNDALQET